MSGVLLRARKQNLLSLCLRWRLRLQLHLLLMLRLLLRLLPVAAHTSSLPQCFYCLHFFFTLQSNPPIASCKPFPFHLHWCLRLRMSLRVHWRLYKCLRYRVLWRLRYRLRLLLLLLLLTPPSFHLA